VAAGLARLAFIPRLAVVFFPWLDVVFFATALLPFPHQLGVSVRALNAEAHLALSET